jgi:polyhydroxyalkanoate synthesis regulator phasin
MAQAPDWNQLLEAGMQFTEMRRSQAKRIAQDLVSQGHIAREQVASTVDELLEMSRRRTEDLSRLVRHEVQRQLGSLGVATKDDLARLERKLTKAQATKAPGVKAAKKTAAKKTTAKKSTAKATSASRTGAQSG